MGERQKEKERERGEREKERGAEWVSEDHYTEITVLEQVRW